MQVDPIKPQLKLPGIKRLELKCDGPLSKFASQSKLRRYTKAASRHVSLAVTYVQIYNEVRPATSLKLTTLSTRILIPRFLS